MKYNSNRRKFIQQSGFLAGATMLSAYACKPSPHTDSNTSNSDNEHYIVGHGEFKYKVNKQWGVQDPNVTPVQNCHEMVQDAKGRLILFTDHVKNNIIIYDRSGKVLDTWTLNLPGAHGLYLR